MTRKLRLFASLTAAIAAPQAGAVGLGPLSEDGVIDGPTRGFSLTLINPYQETQGFRVYAVGEDDELPQPRVAIYPQAAQLAGGVSRRVLVVASSLAPEEIYRFRVCAERSEVPSGVQINARVCSKLSVRRVR